MGSTSSIAAFRHGRIDTKVLFGVLFCGSVERGGVLKLWLAGLLAGSSPIPGMRANGRFGYNRPNARARATASVRRWTWSLPKIFRFQKHLRCRVTSLQLSARSQALFKPVMCIGLVTEGFYLLVSSAPVQLDGFDEVAVRFQVNDRHSRLFSLVLQSL